MSRISYLLIVLFAFVTYSKAQNPTILIDKIALEESRNFIQKSSFVESQNNKNTDSKNR